MQITSVLDALEAERARAPGAWFGAQLGHADIALACALRFLADAHPGLVDMKAYPALSAHAARCEALAVFQAIAQPFIPPKG
jgi:glutathione S-transferase